MIQYPDIATLYELYKQHPNVQTDTRKLAVGAMYFALKGANFNGNAFALQALEQGAAYAVIDEEVYGTHPRCVLVADAQATLQELAHRLPKRSAGACHTL
ncbi:MAG: hypothetical protein EBX41_09525, partial [Chitinophagia bacterium]|nr:hypothetical protein [Chitinophagia bacterium]